MPKPGISTRSYLSRKLLAKLYNKREISDDFIADLILNGSIIKHFSYYKPTVKLLKELKIIPDKIKIVDFYKLAKEFNFTLTDIQDIFACNKDTAELILKKYFMKKHNYWYRKENLVDKLEEGEEVLEL